MLTVPKELQPERKMFCRVNYPSLRISGNTHLPVVSITNKAAPLTYLLNKHLLSSDSELQ